MSPKTPSAAPAKSSKATRRVGVVERHTAETQIRVEWWLDTPEVTQIKTPLPFFNHMLTALAKHGQFGLIIQATGDIDVDPHHLVEDIGIVLGQTLFRALGDSFKGVERAGCFRFPMDGTLADVALDLCGRPNMVWHVPAFESATVGHLDPRLFKEFYKGFVDGALCTLHVNVPYRDNDHHVVEASFKAFAKALRQAVRPIVDAQGNPVMMSTKEAIEAPRLNGNHA